MKKILLYIAIAATVVSCAKDESGGNVPPSEGIATFSAGVVSRVVGNDWESTDEVGIIVLDESAAVSTSHPFNARHTVSTAGVFTPYNAANTIYYSTDLTEEIDFYAYYPYSDAINATDRKYSVDLSAQNEPTKIDFMEAYTNAGYNYESSDVQLTFTRRLTKFTINLKAEDGFELSEVTAVSFEGFYTTAEYSFDSKSFGGFDGADVDITAYKEDSDTYSVLLIPMDDNIEPESYYYTLGTAHKVVFEINNGVDADVVWELYDTDNDTELDIVLKTGSEHTFNVTIRQEDLDGTATIGGWEGINEDATPLTPTEKTT